MRKLVIILIALAAVATFIRAFDTSGNIAMAIPVNISGNNFETDIE